MFCYTAAASMLLAVFIFSIIMQWLTRDKKADAVRTKSFYKDRRLFKNLMSLSLIRKIDTWIMEAGYPRGFTVESYMAFCMICGAAGLITTVSSGLLSGVKVLLITLLPIHLFLYYHIKARKQKIQMELCNIQDIFYFQSRIGTPLDVILAHASKTAAEPLKTPLAIFTEKYKMSKNIEKCLEEFRKTTKLMEFQAFTFILNQREKTGFSAENHYAQATMLKNSKRMKKMIKREQKRLKLLVAAVLMFGCYVLFITVPLVRTVLKSMDVILRP